MTITIKFIMWLIFAFFAGLIEAYLFHYWVKVEKVNKNLHPYFFVQRLLVGIAILLPFDIFDWIELLKFLGLLLAFALTFSFIHNGTYFIYRNKLNPNIYKLKFKDHADGDAVMDFHFESRLMQFIIGVLIITYIITL